jgi:hypothetical protein
MRNRRIFAVAFVITIVLSLSPAVRAEMGHHHDGEHHMQQSHHEGHAQHDETNARAQGADAVWDNYFAIQSALAADSVEGVSEKAEALAVATEDMHDEAMKDGQHSHGARMHVLMKGISDSATSLAKTKDIASAREEFGTLSEKMIDYRKQLGDKDKGDARIFVCDMTQKSWLQNDDEVRNPYFGSKMLGCGREVQ